MSRSPTVISQSLVPSSILYENADQTVVVIDIPRSIEEAQQPWPSCGASEAEAASRNPRQLLSGHPPTTPFPTPAGPSRIDDDTLVGQSLTAQLAELTAQAAVDSALDEIQTAAFDGPWCLPRHIRENEKANAKGKDDEEANNSSPFYIPPQARYLAGTIDACRDEFLSEAPEFDMIIMDPPWPNRSALRRRKGRKRKGGNLDGDGDNDDTGYDTAYNMQSMRELLEQIPVGAKLATTGSSLVAVWVTNKAGCEAMLTDPKNGLFRDWGVELVATWTWLKVTTSGEPVVPLDCHWRKPWERLLIARRPAGVGVKAAARAHPLPTQRVIVGVPDVHSRKPNLRSLLLPYVVPVSEGTVRSSSVLGLEVFARNLTASWWAWGNEALLFQHNSWWTQIPDAEGGIAEKPDSTAFEATTDLESIK